MHSLQVYPLHTRQRTDNMEWVPGQGNLFFRDAGYSQYIVAVTICFNEFQRQHWNDGILKSSLRSGHGRSQGTQGAMPPKFFANLVILCFDKRRPKQNTVVRLTPLGQGFVQEFFADGLRRKRRVSSIKAIDRPTSNEWMFVFLVYLDYLQAFQVTKLFEYATVIPNVSKRPKINKPKDQTLRFTKKLQI